MLEGREFTIFTNHKPLTHALFRVSPLWSTRQQRHLSYLAEFTSSLVLLPGPENIVADALSRPSPVPTLSAFALVSPNSPPQLYPSLPSSDVPVIYGFEISLLSPLQITCPFVSEMSSSPSLSVVSVPLRDGVLLCDSSAGSLQPLVPLQLRRHFFNLLHDVYHPGVCASWRLISSKFDWPGLSCDMGSWARSCLRCQWSKVSTHFHSSGPAILVPTRRFSHIHINIVGPLPSSQGFSYLLTMINRTTCWPEVAPLASISAESCVRAYLSTWDSRFGVSVFLTSNRGAQFTSSASLESVLLSGSWPLQQSRSILKVTG